MTGARQWLAGARPRTLPAAITPVLVGTAVVASTVPGAGLGGIRWVPATLALVVALALQIGVNYANDYSDGIRGTDDHRVGPFRLVGSGAAEPSAVRAAALLALGVACAAGVALVVLTSRYELLPLGAACLAAAWFYTGGPNPYGYRGFGEVSVFVFFGLVSVVGTTYVQTGRAPATAVLGGVGCGALACALLVANNLRDIPTDELSGKRTLAVQLGDSRTRTLFTSLIVMAYAAVAALAVLTTPAVLLALLSAAPAARAVAKTHAGATGRDLVSVLESTALAQLTYGVLLAAGLLAQ